MSDAGTKAPKGVLYPVRPKGCRGVFYQIAAESAPRPVCGRLNPDGSHCRGQSTRTPRRRSAPPWPVSRP